ncbi:hypothetical protein F2Q69_00051765 [Brassica cretica]|uniref:Uncharacterized protein n=1 Tax=Brassica cretica TaxID=69181 RepID=A0A8S9PX44_BRACR|nr:hypothetical protein F2Q69_00051765 [Brassica cretica]
MGIRIILKNLKHDKNEDVAKDQAVKNQKWPVVFKSTSEYLYSCPSPSRLDATNQAKDEPKSYPFPNSGNRGHTQIIPSTMASSQAHFSKLKAGCFKEMVDQIPAILKVRNVKKGNRSSKPQSISICLTKSNTFWKKALLRAQCF